MNQLFVVQGKIGDFPDEYEWWVVSAHEDKAHAEKSIDRLIKSMDLVRGMSREFDRLNPNPRSDGAEIKSDRFQTWISLRDGERSKAMATCGSDDPIGCGYVFWCPNSTLKYTLVEVPLSPASR